VIIGLEKLHWNHESSWLWLCLLDKARGTARGYIKGSTVPYMSYGLYFSHSSVNTTGCVHKSKRMTIHIQEQF